MNRRVGGLGRGGVDLKFLLEYWFKPVLLGGEGYLMGGGVGGGMGGGMGAGVSNYVLTRNMAKFGEPMTSPGSSGGHLTNTDHTDYKIFFLWPHEQLCSYKEYGQIW